MQSNRRHHIGWIVCAVIGLFISGPTLRSATAAETRFTVVDSSSSSWVARGYKNYTVSIVTGWTFSPSRNFDNGVGFNLSGPALPGTAVTNWFLNFSAPGDALITPGSYPNFQRWPFQASDRPGLEFGSTGRLDNQAAGFFNVYEATYGAGGEVLSFAADFTHYGETNPANWANVQIRYNATVPEPATAAIVMFACVGAATIRRRRN